MKPKDNINVDSQELQGRQWLLRRKSTLFGFLVMVYDRVSDGDKLSRENGLGLVLEGLAFMLPVIEKLELKYFFRKR